ncbi:hypothetical protein IMZ11_16610 [Microtetraspora sp. AC03309]|uniref:hypothetical protein n=1 Tax=Microtetraspora sp. AC03309 TaxID=2779376 RepID=UPI001E5253E9|nr:hypothetical protein [Microtetraspora sp. AC03309]MCC5577249.1 hypothetical protein [Microtetraspora sp. AC03309]
MISLLALWALDQAKAAAAQAAIIDVKETVASGVANQSEEIIFLGLPIPLYPEKL